MAVPYRAQSIFVPKHSMTIMIGNLILESVCIPLYYLFSHQCDEYIHYIALHEILHILAMSDSLFPFFWNTETRQFYDDSSVVMSADHAPTDNAYITTKRVTQFAQSHFGCDWINGAPLENTGGTGTVGSHWEGKYLQEEVMCGTKYSSTLFVSGFTMALLEDSGWYQVDYDFAESLPWGHGAGCGFVFGDCVNPKNGKSNFEQYWCTSSDDNGCTADHSSIAKCMNKKSGVIPGQFRWYTGLPCLSVLKLM